MKSKKELDVDFIGGTEPLTREEEMKISDFIRQNKAKQKQASNRTIKGTTSQRRVTT
jgi:hypothetical protein